MTTPPETPAAAPEPLQTIWTTPDLITPQFMHFTDEAVYWLVGCPPEKAAELRARLEAGDKPGEVFSAGCTVLPLAALAWVSSDCNASTIELGWSKGDEYETAKLHCRDFAVRDRLFAHLHRHLGDRWQPREAKTSPLMAVWAPLFCILVVAGATWWLHWLASEAADMAARHGGQLPPGARDFRTWFLAEVLLYVQPLGVLLVGGVLLAIAVWWLVVRLRTPPHEIILNRVPTDTK
jgi:hypothetical protein